MDRSAGMLKLSRQLDDDFRVLRYDRRGYGRSFPHPRAVHDGCPGRRSRRAARRSPSGAGGPQLRRQRRPGDGRPSPRPRRRRRRLRDAAVVGAVVAGARPQGRSPSPSPGNPQDAAERFMRRMLGDHRWEALPERSRQASPGRGRGDGRGTGRPAPSPAVERRATSTLPVVVAFGSLGAAASPPRHDSTPRRCSTARSSSWPTVVTTRR